jgi:hypothetical protein
MVFGALYLLQLRVRSGDWGRRRRGNGARAAGGGLGRWFSFGHAQHGVVLGRARSGWPTGSYLLTIGEGPASGGRARENLVRVGTLTGCWAACFGAGHEFTMSARAAPRSGVSSSSPDPISWSLACRDLVCIGMPARSRRLMESGPRVSRGKIWSGAGVNEWTAQGNRACFQ